MSTARIRWISGPVLRAVAEGPFRMREAVEVGAQRLLGEVIRIEEREIVVQVYEDTTGLRPGVTVAGTGGPLSVRVGPAMLGGIFDGLLRPLSGSSSSFVEPGMREMPGVTMQFRALVHAGDRLEAGAVFGTAKPPQGRDQRCLVPPGVCGTVVRVAPDGECTDTDPLCTLRTDEEDEIEFAMSHRWAVREPRPVAARHPGDQPLFTGQRIVDAIFPIARGGRAAIPGGFGTGKTVFLETLAKWCNADVIVYVGCGERGNEMAGVLGEFPQLEDPRTGRPLLERTVIIANTSNMPVAAREVSIYTGATVAEYFRDQGLHVALMADSTSRWAEALREVSGRLGELPGEGGYPAYLSSRLAEFYERAARVQALCGEPGSLTIMGAVSPPSGDFSEPVTSHTRRYVRTLWALDARRAQARFYPALHPLLSYSEDAERLASWWTAQGNPDWTALRRRFLTLLEDQVRLERMARIIGKDAMPPHQQLVLLCADLLNESFLRQSAFSEVDRFASAPRQVAMMDLLGRFFELAQQAVEEGVAPERIIEIPVFRRLQRMAEEIPEGELERYTELAQEMEKSLAQLRRSHARETLH